MGKTRRAGRSTARRGNRCAASFCRNAPPDDGGSFCRDCRQGKLDRPRPGTGSTEANSTCIVCMDEMTSAQDVGVLPLCGHMLHLACLAEFYDSGVDLACPYGHACHMS